MISNADRELLNETYRNANMGVESIYAIISRVDDEDLALDLNRQAMKFQSIQDRAEDELLNAGHCPDSSKMGKMMLRMSIAGKTMKDRSSEHIADMMIKGNMRGIEETTRIINENKSADRSFCEIAEELVSFEQKNIERLKEYLL